MMNTSDNIDRRTTADHYVNSPNSMGFCVVTLLAWIAASDGNISEEEEAELRSIALASGNDIDLSRAIEIGRRGELETLQFACEAIRTLDPERRHLFLQMAVGISLEDGYLRLPEMHILTFIADLLRLGPTTLSEVFHDLTGHPFPNIGDPSSLAWWQERDPRKSETGSRTSGPEEISQRLRALGVLGLAEDATFDDIREAYLRMVRIHHPDRFVPLGPEATQAATITFQRIRSAYQYLGGR